MSNAYKFHKQEATYFFTMQVVSWVDVFSRKKYCNIICEALNYCVEKKNLNIFSYAIMSNHCHLIANAYPSKISDVVRDLKKFSSTEIINSIKQGSESRRDWMLNVFRNAAAMHARNKCYQVWTHENHQEEVFSSDFALSKIRYIHNNPVRAGIVEKPEHYCLSSARDYSGNPGPVKVSILDLHLLMSGKDSWMVY